jgi:predicted AAA+ superfamily ATPase
MLMTLKGSAGTGKSDVVKGLLDYFQDRIIVASSMAQSSNLVGGTTLHTLLGLPVNAFG